MCDLCVSLFIQISYFLFKYLFGYAACGILVSAQGWNLCRVLTLAVQESPEEVCVFSRFIHFMDSSACFFMAEYGILICIWLTCSPLWALGYHSLSIHQLMDNIWMVLCGYCEAVAVNIVFHMDLTVSVFMDIYKRLKLLDHMATLYLIFWGTDKPIFPKRLYHFTAIAINNIWRFLSASSAALVITSFDYSQP